MPQRLSTQSFEKIWGATELEPWFPNSQSKIGEVWFGGIPNSPLLIKFLFTSDKLSVQVHPTDAYARPHHGSPGKTEMWHILRAQPGAKIAAGFRHEISAAQLRQSAENGEIEQLLQWHDARAGDTFFIPAGTIHAIGGGLALCEIQQNSDITYRLYDYGRPRELHLDHALRVSRRGPHNARVSAAPAASSAGAAPASSEGSLLVSCEYFTTHRIQLNGTLRHSPVSAKARGDGDQEWWIVIGGSGTIAGDKMRAGEVWYCPPGQPPFELSGDATLLRTVSPASSQPFASPNS